MVLWPLASLLALNSRATSLGVLPKPMLSPLHKSSLAPDDQLFCCNSLYFDFVLNLLDDIEDLSPAWQTVGRHMYWAPAVQETADNYTRQALGVEPGQQIPPVRVLPLQYG